MIIRILSQNMAAKEISNVSSTIVTDTFASKPDIYVEFTQEDNRNIDESSIIEETLLNGYHNICVEALSAKQHFNVITKVYSKKENTHIIKKKSGHVKINALSGLLSGVESTLSLIRYPTKGASWALISCGKDDILFINMHLPVDTGKFSLSLFKNESLGNEYRIKSMVDCVNTILKEIGTNPLKIFIGGDLNFRVIGVDQLKTYLTQDSTKSEFPFVELSTDLGSTCKYLTSCSLDRTNKRECLDTKRSPSRCDRILTNTNAKVLDEHNFVMDPTLDHNAILLTLDLPLSKDNAVNKAYPNKGGRRYRRTIKRSRRTKKYRK